MRILKTLLLLLVCVSIFGQDIPPPPPPPPPGYTPQELTPNNKNAQDRPLLLSRRIPVNIQTKLTALHERIRGTKLFVLPSDRFIYDGIKFVDKTDPRYFYILAEKKGDYSKIADSMIRTIPEFADGAGLHTNITYNTMPGKIVEAIDPDGKAGFSAMLAGTDSTCIFGMFYYNMADKEMMDIMVKTIGSVYLKKNYPLTPGESFTFTFKDTVTGFKMGQYTMNSCIYTHDGKYSEKDFFKTNYQLGSYPYMNSQQIKQVFDQVPVMMGSVFNLFFKEVETDLKLIDDFPMSVMEYDVKNEDGRKSGRLYAAIVQGKNSTIMFYGFSTSDHEAYKKKWSKILETIHFKKE